MLDPASTMIAAGKLGRSVANIKMRELQVFSAVLRTGATTRAGEILGLSQPAVSAAISGLEAELGFHLFDRVKGRLQPTIEAGYFYESVHRLIDEFNNLGQVAKDIREANVGHVRIAASHAFSQHLLPRVIARFRSLRPNVEIIVHTQSSHQVREGLHAQQFDIGIAELPVFHQSVEIEEIAFPCVCVMKDDCALAQLPFVTPNDMKDYPLILNSPDHMVTFQINKAFREAGVEPRTRIEAQLMGVACAIAQQGAGIAIVDQLTATHYTMHGIAIRQINPVIILNVAIITPKLRPRSIATKLFHDLLREEIFIAASDRHLEISTGIL